jgi:hypothetical protein
METFAPRKMPSATKINDFPIKKIIFVGFFE